MSELNEILNSAQLTKHYELLQFLSAHANREYTMAQLDYLLPRGASIQRFPGEWVEFMDSGRCSNQSIELHRRCLSEGDQMGRSIREGEEELVLICRRPELKSLTELNKFLQSSAVLPDPEGCVALHTDQIILTEHLLREGQLRGLFYYFPDSYAKNRERKGGKGRRFVSSHSEALSDFLSEEESKRVLGLGDGVAGMLELPNRVSAQFMLYTRRGVPVRGKNSIPTRIHCGERIMVIFERTASSPSSPVMPEAEKAPALRTSLGQPTGTVGGAIPIHVRVKVSSGRSSASGGCGMRSYMEIRAQGRGKVALSIFIDEEETILQFEVMDECTDMPGVLIGREAQPAISLPDDIRIHDPALWNGAMNTASDATGETSAPSPLEETPTGSTAPSWWLNASPAVLQVRDFVLPSSETVAAAARLVWIPHEADEDAMRKIRDVLRRQDASNATRKKRQRRSRTLELRNHHMVHFGFDASVPFNGEPQ